MLAIVLLDILHKLLVDDAVVMVKMSSVNEYIGPHIKKMLQPLVDEGFVDFAYGRGGEVSCSGEAGIRWKPTSAAKSASTGNFCNCQPTITH